MHAIDQLAASYEDLRNVTTLQTAADQLNSPDKNLVSQSFNTAIINSVAQYFPDESYLTQVINTLVDLTADGGTLFLDEIGELPLEAQARLLRVLQEGEVRRVGSVETIKVKVRLVAATHRDLKSLAKTGGFREDLYYRLNVVKLTLPPLRERRSDLEELSQHFLRLNCEKLGKPCLSFSEESRRLIESYHWPGNIRELENAIERAVILCEEPVSYTHLTLPTIYSV